MIKNGVLKGILRLFIPNFEKQLQNRQRRFNGLNMTVKLEKEIILNTARRMFLFFNFIICGRGLIWLKGLGAFETDFKNTENAFVSRIDLFVFLKVPFREFFREYTRLPFIQTVDPGSIRWRRTAPGNTVRNRNLQRSWRRNLYGFYYFYFDLETSLDCLYG